MTEEKFFEYLEANLSDDSMDLEDLIITFKMYDAPHKFHFENVLLLVNTELKFPYYEWEYDWWEGQDYDIMGFIPVSCVLTMEYNGKNINNIMNACRDIKKLMREVRNEVTDE